MNLGELNETVQILTPTVAGRSSTGEDLVSWSTLDHWDVNVQLVNGAERLGASDAPTNVNVYRVTGRARTDVQPTMRLRRGTALLEIQTVPPNPRSMWTVAIAVEMDRGAS